MIGEGKVGTVVGRDAMVPVAYRVVSNEEETHDTFTLRIEPAEAVKGRMEFLPGQFNMLYAFGTGESAISISGDPGDAGPLVHTVRRVGAVTRKLGELGAGDTLGVRGPFGSAWPMGEMEGRDLVFVAGGIGLAPLRPAIYEAFRNRGRYGKIVILVGARTVGDLLYGSEILGWKGADGIEVNVTVDRAEAAWKGNVGVVTRLVGRAGFDPANAVAMVCGPEIMMRYTVAALQERGVADAGIYLTMERNMKCAVGFCGHCQFGPEFICRDGAVFGYGRIARWLSEREL